MNLSALFLLFIFCNVSAQRKNTSKKLSLELKKLVNNYGYPFEIHNVETEDGYLLEIHRIPNGLQKSESEQKKGVAFLKAGLADTSAAFLISGPNLSLAYILADKGYDVWLGNHRGNSFCKEHKIYLEKDHRFWNFSWHEIGLYDNTVMIDYILETTKQEKLFHVCHSEGCAEFYVMTSLNPEYNNKIILSVNLAPAVFFSHVSLTARTVLTYFYLLKNLYAYKGHSEVLNQGLLFRIITRIFCKNNTPLRPFCYIAMYIIQGFDWFDTDSKLLSNYLGYYPAGASSKQFIHYAMSLYNSGSFRQFDYGKSQNMKIYNSTIPPKYPLKRVTVPVSIYYGDSDNMVSAKDAEQLSKKLPHVTSKKLLKRYNHGGYFLHRNAKVLIYDEVVKMFEKYKIGV